MSSKLKGAAETLPLILAFLSLPLLGFVWALFQIGDDGAPDARPTAAAEQTFTFRTGADSDGLGFFGVGGEIEGVRNPLIEVALGTTVEVILENGDGAEHDISVPEFGVTSGRVAAKGATTSITFTTDKEGTFEYFCTLTGHKQAGMVGTVRVGAGAGEDAIGADIVRPPTDLPLEVPPVSDDGMHHVSLEAVELEGQLAPGTTYEYWTFGGKVPGPFIRVRVGDSVELALKNRAGNKNTHSIDLHAVTGPGGGAAVTQVPPGEEKMFGFKALNPGLYIYHCATPSVAHHMASGMYGLILVEPEAGLPPVDHEFYVVQGEVYTAAAFGEKGAQEFSQDRMLDEDPEYMVLNGAVGALTEQNPLTAETGDTVRIFFGVGGPNATSSFHVIGEIFDRVYDQASLTSAPLTNVQTTTVAPGGATMVEFTVEVPGRYILVDHALSRLERGLAGFLNVTGDENPDIFHGEVSGDSGGH